ncbi:MAG TPA: aminotransferase class V-fold PLP-dependent enzyme [Natronosporangium sp.]|nr:aminotransferase class V-fold PLP-dependent enzyme [Natronosporangium sp.]
MSASADAYDAALQTALRHARARLAELPTAPVVATATAEQVRRALGETLPEQPTDPAEVVELLATAARPGLVGSPSGRFYGFVIGGVLPAALAADWLTSAWDQNSGLRVTSPAQAALEDLAAAWLVDLLGLPVGSAVGFVTGGTMANFTGLAAGRDAVLARAGWDVAARGLAGAPKVRVLVGAERHDTVDLALRYLGLGAPEVVPADAQGRVRASAMRETLAAGPPGPTIVCLQAGNVHSGAFDPFAEIIPAARAAGAWVHVDGAFGLWAAANPGTRELVAGVDGADSWATDAHKTLNVPYDSGLAVVRDPAAIRAAMSIRGDYLIPDETHLDPHERVPELSRRGRAVAVWAALRSLGRSGVAELVDRLCRHATALAGQAAVQPEVTVLNDVVFTQVCLWFGSDRRTREVSRRLLADGRVWMTGSRWQGREVLRISMSNWSTDEADVAVAAAALRDAVAATA